MLEHYESRHHQRTRRLVIGGIVVAAIAVTTWSLYRSEQRAKDRELEQFMDSLFTAAQDRQEERAWELGAHKTKCRKNSDWEFSIWIGWMGNGSPSHQTIDLSKGDAESVCIEMAGLELRDEGVELAINVFEYVGDEAIACIAAASPQLVHFSSNALDSLAKLQKETTSLRGASVWSGEELRLLPDDIAYVAAREGADFSAVMDQLPRFNELEGLYLSRGESRIETHRLAALPSTLRVLDLTWTHVRDDIVEHLVRLPNLRELSLVSTDLTATGVEVLRRNPELNVCW